MALLLLVAFVVVPLLELAIILQVGQLIGTGWTIVALLAVSVAGAWLVRREGTRAWSRLRAATRAGRMPTDEALDGALVLVGGALLLTPGFFTDAVGLSLVFPLTRVPIAAAVRQWISRRVVVSVLGPDGRMARRVPGGGRASRGASGAEVIDVDAVEVDPADGRPPADDGRRPGGRSHGGRTDRPGPDGRPDGPRAS